MTCKKCSRGFCWLCNGPDGHHNCSGLSGAKKSESVSGVREELERFLHYSGRYLAHKQSLALEVKLKEKVEVKVAQLQHKFKVSVQEAQFLLDAYDALIRCRTALTYTFAFAFYLKDSHDKTIFEEVCAD